MGKNRLALLLAYIVTVSSPPFTYQWTAEPEKPVYIVRTEKGELAGTYPTRSIAEDTAECLNNAHTNLEEVKYWDEVERDPSRAVVPPEADQFRGKRP